jgi:hypothetical protein
MRAIVPAPGPAAIRAQRLLHQIFMEPWLFVPDSDTVAMEHAHQFCDGWPVDESIS